MSGLPMSPSYDVVIAGASYTGLTLALALARTFGNSLRIAVAEPRPAGAPLGDDVRAFAIAAGPRRLLEAIGVWPLTATAAEPVLRIEITDSPLTAGIRPVLLTYDNTLAEGEPATHIVPCDALMAALERAVAEEPLITIITGAGIESHSASPEGAIARLSDGRQIKGRLVVAADGRRSPVRTAAGIGIVTWPSGQVGIVTRVSHQRPHGSTAVQHFLPAGPFAILPLPGNRSCITWSEGAPVAERIMALADEAFFAEIDLRFGGRLGALSLEGGRRSWPLSTHLARSYVADRLALVGDAAHGVHPIAGQGLNLALRDVAALTECLADSARVGLEVGDAGALERYQRWRRFDSTVSAVGFDGLNRLFSKDWPLLRSAREIGLGIVDRLPGLKRRLVEQAAGLSGATPKLLAGTLP
jgi:2-octaprenyl-6-methoxyphenol hydroxylase